MKCPPRHVPIAMQTKLRFELDGLVDRKVITPVTKPTEWCSKISVQTKESGPRPLNEVLQRSVILSQQGKRQCCSFSLCVTTTLPRSKAVLMSYLYWTCCSIMMMIACSTLFCFDLNPAHSSARSLGSPDARFC